MVFVLQATMPSSRTSNTHDQTTDMTQKPKLKLAKARATSWKIFPTIRWYHRKPFTRDNTSVCFTDLPAELRVQIYQAVLRTEHQTEASPPEITNRFGWFLHVMRGYEEFHRFCYPAQPAIDLTLIHALRLTSHQIKDEFDIELIKYSVSRVKIAIRDLRCPLGHESSLLGDLAQHDPSRPMPVMNPVPKTYNDIQKLRLTTYVSEGPLCWINRGIQLLELFYALPVCVRSVTLSIVIAENVNDKEIEVDGINAVLAQCYYGLCKRGMHWRFLTPHKSIARSRTGIDHVKVVFPVGMVCGDQENWDKCERNGKNVGLALRQVKNGNGLIGGIVFDLKRAPSKRLALQLAWKKAQEWARK